MSDSRNYKKKKKTCEYTRNNMYIPKTRPLILLLLLLIYFHLSTVKLGPRPFRSPWPRGSKNVPWKNVTNRRTFIIRAFAINTRSGTEGKKNLSIPSSCRYPGTGHLSWTSSYRNRFSHIHFFFFFYVTLNERIFPYTYITRVLKMW